MTIRTAGVIGAGVMGSGIAQVIATAGVAVLHHDTDPAQLRRSRGAMEESLRRLVSRGKVTEEERGRALELVRPAASLEEMAGADLVIEAVVEDLDVKRKLWNSLEGIAGPDAVFATNTSSLSVIEQAAGLERPGRLVGMHFFNPVPMMALVEIVPSVVTAAEVVASARTFAESIGKVPVTASDRCGFIVNRLLVPYLMDAVRAVEQGVGSIADIDSGMKLGAGHPMGPLMLLDVIGLDTAALIGDIMHREYHEARFAAPPLLRRMVAAGWKGRKGGLGFYDWTGAEPVARNPG